MPPRHGHIRSLQRQFGATHRGRGRGWRPWLAGGLSFVVPAALIGLAIARLDMGHLWRAVSSMEPEWVIVAGTLMASSFFARGESWFVIIRAAAPTGGVGRRAVMRGLLIGILASTVAPGRVGEAARTWVVARRLDRERESVAIVVGTVVSQTLLNLLALAVLAAVALTGAAITNPRVGALAVALALPAAIASLLLGGPSILRRAAGSRRHQIRRVAGWLTAQIARARQGMAAFRQPRAASHAAIAQMTAWALQLGTCYAIIVALGMDRQADLVAAAGVLLAVNLSAVVPVTPSNVGVFQAACIAVLGSFGVAAGRGLAYGIVLQSIEVASALVLGVPALLHEGLSWTDVRHHADIRGGGTD
jgi:phosphatidylinositol alpha-mannosyltransferase